MGVKSKISKNKRNNQKKNKLVKRGVIKKSLNSKKHEIKKTTVARNSTVVNASDSDDSDHAQDMLDMVEKDDLDFLKNAITSHSYNIYNRVKLSRNQADPKLKKRKISNEDSDLENEFEKDNDVPAPMKALLPLKTERGVIRRQIVDESPEQFDTEEAEKEEIITQNNEVETVEFLEDGIDISEPVSATQLFASRNEILKQKRLHIGTLSAGVLENPEEKITNLRTLIQMMDQENSEGFITIRKLATVSLLEIFKDLLPSYEIKKVINDNIKLKKDTLKLQKYEEQLLMYYKKYLEKLEKFSKILIRKISNSKKSSQEERKLGCLAINSLSELLEIHPYFNFAVNVAHVIIPFLNHPQANIREIVKSCVKTVFKEDKKNEMTLKMMRMINAYLKSHLHNVRSDVLEVLLVLNLKDINLDQDKEDNIKQKNMMARKQKIMQMSKREKKRKKKLQLLEKEMLETKAEESKQVKQQNLTEITKITFGIYFRILKNSNNSGIMSVCLEGLAKFAHCINIEFYIDIVNTLDRLLKEDWLAYREKLHCIQTVFTILNGQGEALNVDPIRFYTNLYKDLFLNSALKQDNYLIVLKILNDALIKRRRKITNKRIIAFSKRLSTLSLQLLHDGAICNLNIIQNIMQLNGFVDILLDMDDSVGDGKFQPELDDPEYANAANSAHYEMILLSKHYHPIVCKYAKNILAGTSASCDGNLTEFANCTPEQLFATFTMSEMAFHPAVPIPKKPTARSMYRKHQFVNSSFKDYCKSLIHS